MRTWGRSRLRFTEAALDLNQVRRLPDLERDDYERIHRLDDELGLLAEFFQ